MEGEAVVLYEKKAMQGKRRLLDFVCSNSQWRDGKLIPTYRKPLDLLASTNMTYTKTKAASPVENGFCPIWLPFVDTLRNELAIPSKAILGTFAAIQEEVYT
jgi:hypothetical protein